MKKYLKDINQKGFTLIEIIVVIFILGIAFVPILNYFTNSVGFVREVEVRSQALNIAGDAVESVKAKSSDWDDLEEYVNNLSIDEFSNNYDLLANFGISGNLNSFDFNDDGVEGSDDDEIGMQLDITVSWNDSSETVSTLIRKR